MFNNKLFNMSFIILIGITILGVVVVVLWKTTFPQADVSEHASGDKKISAEEMVELSVKTEEITTNLYTNNYIVIQFSILLDSKKAKEEFEKRNELGEVRAIMISVLSSLTPEDLKGEEGINRLEAVLMNRLNEILHKGKVKRVLTINRKIQ